MCIYTLREKGIRREYCGVRGANVEEVGATDIEETKLPTPVLRIYEVSVVPCPQLPPTIVARSLLPPAFRQARFVTAWRKPRKLGDILRYRLNTVSTSPLAHANGSADMVRESVSSPDHDESEGSGDDFFQATRFYTPSDSGRSSSSDSND